MLQMDDLAAKAANSADGCTLAPEQKHTPLRREGNTKARRTNLALKLKRTLQTAALHHH